MGGGVSMAVIPSGLRHIYHALLMQRQCINSAIRLVVMQARCKQSATTVQSRLMRLAHLGACRCQATREVLGEARRVLAVSGFLALRGQVLPLSHSELK